MILGKRRISEYYPAASPAISTSSSSFGESGMSSGRNESPNTSYESECVSTPGTNVDYQGTTPSQALHVRESALAVSLRTGGRKKAPIWKYFSFDTVKGDRVSISCLVCTVWSKTYTWEKYTRKKGSTYQMECHLASKHRIENAELTGQGNLVNTIQKCMERTGSKLQSKSEFEKRILLWIIDTHQPFNVLKNKYFYDALQFYPHQANLMSATTVRRRIIELYKTRKYDMIVALTQMNANIHLTFDCWTSQDRVRTFMAIIAHFIGNDFKYREYLLDFVSIEGRHTGKVLAEYVFNVLKEWKLTGKVMTVVGDNATNNDTLAGTPWHSSQSQMPRGRCLSHVINLGAQ